MHLATGRPAIYQLFDAEARPETTNVPVLVFISSRNTQLTQIKRTENLNCNTYTAMVRSLFTT
jgi:hypothetical protein